MGVDLKTSALRQSYEGLAPEVVVERAWSEFGPEVALTSSFQTQSVPLLHIVSRVAPGMPVLFLDTGYHFPETLTFRDRLAREWGLDVRSLRAGTAGSLQGPELFLTDPDLCCRIHKVEPMRRAAAEYDAILSGIRRDQTSDRANAAVVEEREGTLRIHPVLSWTEADVWSYLERHELPVHPLHHHGYESIGCAPCTRPVRIGEDSRAGRWTGSDKTECGLHITGANPEPTRRRSTG